MDAGLLSSIHLESHPRQKGNPLRFLLEQKDSSADFHILFAEAADNSVLLGFIRTLVRRCVVIQSLYKWPERDPCLLHEHADIIEAVEAGDVEEAVLRMRHHLSHVQDTIKLHASANDELDVYKTVGRS